MGRPFSARKRQDILCKLETGQNDRTILAETDDSIRQLRKMRRDWEQFGELVRPRLASGRPRMLSAFHQAELLVYLISDRPPT